MSAGSVNNVLLANIASVAGIAKSNIASIAGSTVVGGLVTDGLILNLDSTDTNSYPGTGTSWDDLTSESNDFTLVNGPTFSTDDGGTIVTDGANDYIEADAVIDQKGLQGQSVFAYVKCTDLTSTTYSGKYLTQILSGDDTGNSTRAMYNMRFEATTGNWSTYGYQSLTIWLKDASYANAVVWYGWDESTVPQILEDEWYYVGYTTDGESGDTLDAFVNGVKVGSGTLTADRGNENRGATLASDSWSKNFGMPGSNRNYHMYSRKLTDAEVLQNYNAIKI